MNYEEGSHRCRTEIAFVQDKNCIPVLTFESSNPLPGGSSRQISQYKIISMLWGSFLPLFFGDVTTALTRCIHNPEREPSDV
jgi:hypothetical protein